MKLNYKLGELIRNIDVKNKDLHCNNLKGLSMTKEFRASTSNIVGTDLSKYKIVAYKQFACDFMSAIRVHKMPIAFNSEMEEILVSPAYAVFEVIDENIILPEYLMMWFRRSEFDRYADFRSDAAIRGGYGWNELCETEIKLPSLEEQRKKVQAYKTITDRIELKKKINDNLEATLTAIFKKMFIEDNTISFCNKKLYELTETIDNRGKTPPNNNIETPYPLIEIASLRTDGRIATYRNCSKFVTEEVYNSWFRSGHPKQKDILMSTVGSLAELKLFWGDKGSIAQNIVAFRCYDNNLPMYLYQYLLRKQHELAAYEIGSVQASIKVSQVIEYDIAIPPKELLDSFDKISTQLTELIYQNEADIDVCHKLSDTLLQRLTLQD